jgi:primosomal protein N''
VEIRQQLVVEKKLQLVPASKLVEKKKLQQPVSIGEEFIEELFEKRPVSNIIP